MKAMRDVIKDAWSTPISCEKGIVLKQSGNEVDYTACSLLVIFTNLCRKLYSQKGFRFILLPYNISIITLETTKGQIDGFSSQFPFKCHSRGWHLWEIDLRFAPGLPPGWSHTKCSPSHFCKSQFPHKSVNLFLILVIVNDKFTDLWGC